MQIQIYGLRTLGLQPLCDGGQRTGKGFEKGIFCVGVKTCGFTNYHECHQTHNFISHIKYVLLSWVNQCNLGRLTYDCLLGVGPARSRKYRLRGDGFGWFESRITYGPLSVLLSSPVTFRLSSFSRASAQVTPPIPCFLMLSSDQFFLSYSAASPFSPPLTCQKAFFLTEWHWRHP